MKTLKVQKHRTSVEKYIMRSVLKPLLIYLYHFELSLGYGQSIARHHPILSPKFLGIFVCIAFEGLFALSLLILQCLHLSDNFTHLVLFSLLYALNTTFSQLFALLSEFEISQTFYADFRLYLI